MDLQKYVDRLREELGAAADAGGDDTRRAAANLISVLDSAARLVVLEAVADAADEITRELAPGSVEVRLRGITPTFVTTVVTDEVEVTSSTSAAEQDATDLEAGPTARINLRLPLTLKARVEAAAARERLSINTWLVRVAAGALSGSSDGAGSRTGEGARHGGQDLTGWVH